MFLLFIGNYHSIDYRVLIAPNIDRSHKNYDNNMLLAIPQYHKPLKLKQNRTREKENGIEHAYLNCGSKKLTMSIYVGK